MKTFIMLLFLAFMTRASASEAMPKTAIVVESKRYLYADAWVEMTGGQRYRHVIVVYEDDRQFEHVQLFFREKPPWPPVLSTPTMDVGLAAEGVYLIRKIGDRFIVDLIDSGSPQSDGKQKIEEYVATALKRPSPAPEQPSTPVKPPVARQ